MGDRYELGLCNGHHAELGGTRLAEDLQAGALVALGQHAALLGRPINQKSTAIGSGRAGELQP